MRGKDGRWLYAVPCGKRAKWPSKRRTLVYSSDDTWVRYESFNMSHIIYMTHIIWFIVVICKSVTEMMNEYSKYLHPKQFSSSGGVWTPIVLFGDLKKEPKVIFSDFAFIFRYISFRISIERLKHRLDNVFLSVIASIPPRYWILK